MGAVEGTALASRASRRIVSRKVEGHRRLVGGDDAWQRGRPHDARTQPYRAEPYWSAGGGPPGVRMPPGVANLRFARLLRQIPLSNPLIAAAIHRRVMQIAAFAKRPAFAGDIGFEVRLRDPLAKATPAAKRRMREIEELILRGGLRREHPETGEVAVWNAEYSAKAPRFDKVLRTLVRDSLTLDAAAVEIQPGWNERKYPVAFWRASDAALIRYAAPARTGTHALDEGSVAMEAPYQTEVRPEIGSGVAFVRVDRTSGQTVTAEYGWNELAYMVRNPRSDEEIEGYGLGELEVTMLLASSILFGIKYNCAFFNENKMPAGIVVLQGQYGNGVSDDLREQLANMAAGPDNWFSLPVLEAENDPGSPPADAKFVPIRQDPGNGMMWKDGLMFCASIFCAVIGMDSGEINVVNFGSSNNSLGQTQPLGKLEMAQDIGLRSMLTPLGSTFDEIVERVDPEFEFGWCGVDRADEERERQASAFRFSQGASLNEERALRDEPAKVDPLEDGLWADCLLTARRDLTAGGDEAADGDIEALATRLYRAAGGRLAKWPDAPIGCPAALELWKAEHGLATPAEGRGGTDAPGLGGEAAAGMVEDAGEFLGRKGPPVEASANRGEEGGEG